MNRQIRNHWSCGLNAITIFFPGQYVFHELSPIKLIGFLDGVYSLQKKRVGINAWVDLNV